MMFVDKPLHGMYVIGQEAEYTLFFYFFLSKHTKKQ